MIGVETQAMFPWLKATCPAPLLSCVYTKPGSPVKALLLLLLKTKDFLFTPHFSSLLILHDQRERMLGSAFIQHMNSFALFCKHEHRVQDTALMAKRGFQEQQTCFKLLTVELFNTIKLGFDHMSNWIKNSTFLIRVL